MARNDVTILLSGKDEASKVLRAVAKEADVTSARFRNLSTSLGDAGRTLTATVTAPILAVGGAAIKMGMDAVESEDLFERSMGGMANAAREWTEDLQESLGINDYAARKTLATFNVMLESMGLNEQAALSMSEGLTKLGYDLASLHNKPIEEMFQKLRSGLMGQTEPMQALGVALDMDTVKQYAWSKGIAKSGQELNANQKLLARYGLMLERTEVAHDNMALTLQSPANQLRVLQEQITLSTTELGIGLIPVIKAATEELKPFVDKLGELTQKFDEMPDSSKKFITAGVGIAAAAGPVALIASSFSKLASMVVDIGPKLIGLAVVGRRVSDAFTLASAGAISWSGALTKAAGGPAGVITLAMIGIAVGATRIITNWEAMRVGGLNMWGQLKIAAIDFADWVVRSLEKVTRVLPFVSRGLRDLHSDLQVMKSEEWDEIISRDKAFNSSKKKKKTPGKDETDIQKKLIEQAKRDAEAIQKAIEEAQKKADAQNKKKKAEKVRTPADVKADMEKQIDAAGLMEKILGKEFDFNSARASALSSALKELTEMGLKPGIPILDKIIARYKVVTKEQQSAEDASNRLSTTKDLLNQASQVHQEWLDREVSSYEKLARQLEAQAKLDKSRASKLIEQASALRELEKAEKAETAAKEKSAAAEAKHKEAAEEYVDLVSRAFQQIGSAYEGDITENERIARQLEARAQTDGGRREALLGLADTLRQVDLAQQQATDSAESLSQASDLASESQSLLSQASQEFTNWNERNLSSLEKLARQLESQAMLDSERADSLLSQASALRELEQAQNSYNSALEMETKTRDLLDKAKATLASGDEKGLSEFERLARELDAQAGAETDHNRSWDLQAQARALREKDWMDSMGKMEFVVDSTTKAFNQFKESLTNVPQGFKMALARWNSATPASGMPYAVGGAGNAVAPINITIGHAWGADDVKKSIRQAVAEGDRRQRIAAGGSYISK